jgi:hypothetical protein
MMLALTYGMMPSAKIDRFPSAPPLNMLKRPSSPPPCLCTTAFITCGRHPGDRHEDADPVDRQSIEREEDAPPQLGDLADVGEGGESDMALTYGSGLRASDQDDLAACLLDLLRRDLGERVRRDGDGLGELAVAEDLDAVEAPLDEPARDERLLVDVRARGEDLEIADVDLGDLRRERVVKPRLGRRRWIGVWPPSKCGLKPRVRGRTGPSDRGRRSCRDPSRRRARGASSSWWPRRAWRACSACQP